MTRMLSEPARQTEVFDSYDVVVLGGGPAGIAAALSAARAGRRTILLERYGFLGGAGTAAGVSSFCGLYSQVYDQQTLTTRGLADDILDKLRKMDALATPQPSLGGRVFALGYDISAYKIAAEDLLIDAGVYVLYHALAVGQVSKSEAEIGAVIVETKEGRFAIEGKIFIDGSGDGDLAAWAGAPFAYGDEHGHSLYPSTMYRISGVDPVRAKDARALLPKLMEEEERRTGVPFPRKQPSIRQMRNPSEWRTNLTQVRNPDGSPVSGIDARQLSAGETEGRRQSWETFSFIKRVTPGFEEAYIIDIAPQIGIRETRRIIGDYVLTEEDILECRDFPDSIGVNGWPIEGHVAGDLRLAFAPEGSRGYNHLPYRMILPQRVDNLFVVGRCASMTHDGQSSARVSGPCFSMGQAAGTAADMALALKGPPRAIDVRRLQDRLRQDGVFLG